MTLVRKVTDLKLEIGRVDRQLRVGIVLKPEEVEFTAIRAQGPGGQNVNKVSNAVHLRFDIAGSSLPEAIKERLLALSDQRISKEGIVVIKAQRLRSLEKNRAEGLLRLQEMVDQVAVLRTVRRATRATRSAQRKRLDSKNLHGKQKALRAKVQD